MKGLRNCRNPQFIIPDEVIAHLDSLSSKVTVPWRRQIRKERIFSLIGDNNVKILDVGCGIGDFAVELALRGNRVLGIDTNKERIEIAKQLAVDYKADNAIFEAADFLGKDFQDEKFDGVLLCEVAEHFDDPLLPIKKSYSLLRVGGWLIISVPNIVSLRNRLVFLIKGAFPDNQEFHRYYFTRRDLVSRLYQSGFKVKNIIGDFIPFHYGLPWLKIKGFLANIFIDLSYTIIVKAIKSSS